MSRETARKVLEIEAEAIRALVPRLDESFDRAVEILLACAGRVVATGMGKSGIIAQKISATLASTGQSSFFLHPAEAIHGDLGRIVKGDVVVALSHSGDTEELLALLPWLKRLGVPIVAMTGSPRSPLAQAADVHLDVSIRTEACPLGLAPTASTTAALAMGDALSMALLEQRGFTVEDFAVLHPGGRLGKKLLRVEDVDAHGRRASRACRPQHAHEGRPLRDDAQAPRPHDRDRGGRHAASASSSDGDLRRQMERHGYSLLDRTAAECMTSEPATVDRHELATKALDVMERPQDHVAPDRGREGPSGGRAAPARPVEDRDDLGPAERASPQTGGA